MEKFKLMPFYLGAFMDGAIALSADGSMLARYVDRSVKADDRYPIFVVYFPVRYAFIEGEVFPPIFADRVTPQGAYYREPTGLDLKYLVDGLTLLDIPELDVHYPTIINKIEEI